MVMSISLVFVAFFFIHNTDVLLAPFHHPQQQQRHLSSNLLVMISINLGFFIFKCFLTAIRADQPLRKRLHLMHYLVAIVTFTMVLITKENSILAIIGFLMQGHVGVASGERVQRFLGRDHTKFYKLTLLVLLIVVLSVHIFLPLLFLITALVAQSPSGTSATSQITLYLSTIYFCILNSTSVVKVMLRICNNGGSDNYMASSSRHPEIVSPSGLVVAPLVRGNAYRINYGTNTSLVLNKV